MVQKCNLETRPKMFTTIFVIAFLVITVNGTGHYEFPEEIHEECHCPKPKTVTKYVVVETPKYIPVYKTKYVTIQEGYSKYDDAAEYKRK